MVARTDNAGAARGTPAAAPLQLSPEVLKVAQEARNGLQDTIKLITSSLASPTQQLDANQKKEIKAAVVDLKQALAALRSVPAGGTSPDLSVGGRPTRPPNAGPIALYGVFFMSTTDKLYKTTAKLRETLETDANGLRLKPEEKKARTLIRKEINEAIEKLVRARDGISTTTAASNP